MAPITNGRLLFNEIPVGYPVAGKTTIYDDTQQIDLDNVQLAENSILIKVLYLSVDPYFRNRMRDPKVKYYSSPFTLGKPIDGQGIGLVIQSTHPQLAVGDHIYGRLAFTHYFISENPGVDLGGSGGTGFSILKNEENLPWSVYLGVLGMPGRTAFYAWKEYAKAKKGEVAYVTTGAGPVGSFVIQLAKRDGMKVIASAGSAEKLESMKEYGADVVFNYKTTSTEEVLEKEGPIDVFWDNVGGETFDAALANAAVFGRFIECGSISGYNDKTPKTYKNLNMMMARRLTIQGFLIWDLDKKHGEDFLKTVTQWVKNGDIKYREDIKNGLELAGHAIQDVQMGRNNGKSIVKVAE